MKNKNNLQRYLQRYNVFAICGAERGSGKLDLLQRNYSPSAKFGCSITFSLWDPFVHTDGQINRRTIGHESAFDADEEYIYYLPTF